MIVFIKVKLTKSISPLASENGPTMTALKLCNIYDNIDLDEIFNACHLCTRSKHNKCWSLDINTDEKLKRLRQLLQLKLKD